jgi:hypothetical protein
MVITFGQTAISLRKIQGIICRAPANPGMKQLKNENNETSKAGGKESRSKNCGRRENQNSRCKTVENNHRSQN